MADDETNELWKEEFARFCEAHALTKEKLRVRLSELYPKFSRNTGYRLPKKPPPEKKFDDFLLLLGASESEMERLKAAAGYGPRVVPLSQPASSALIPERCVVHTYDFERGVAYPHHWLTVMARYERLPRGRIRMVNDDLPVITRPAEFFRESRHADLFSTDVLDAYIREHEARQEAYLTRMLTNTTEHVYSAPTLRSYIHDSGPRTRYPQAIPFPVRVQHVQHFIHWLSNEDLSFFVRITNRYLPPTFIIFGLDLVLIDFSHSNELLPGTNILGIELQGESIVNSHLKQFDSAWDSGDDLVAEDNDEAIAWLNEELEKAEAEERKRVRSRGV